MSFRDVMFQKSIFSEPKAGVQAAIGGMAWPLGNVCNFFFLNINAILMTICSFVDPRGTNLAKIWKLFHKIIVPIADSVPLILPGQKK